MNAFAIHFAFQFRSALRNSSQLLLSYLFPLGFYLFVGAVMTGIYPAFRDNLIPSMTLFTVMTGPLLGLPGPLVDEREAGIYRSYRVNGVPAAAILAMPAVTTAFHALIAAAVVAVSAGPIFGAPLPTSWPALAAITVLAAATFSAFGTLIGVVSADSRVTVLLAQAIFLPSMLLGGLMVQLDVLPAGAARAGLLLPTSWLAQLDQGLAYGRPTIVDPALALIVLAAATVIAFAVAAFAFDWDRRNAARRGHPALALLAIVPLAIGALVSM